MTWTIIFEETGEKLLNVNLPHFRKNIDTKNFHQIDFHPKKKRKESLLLVPGDYHADFTTSQPHWRRSNEMLQGQLLDNSFNEKAKWCQFCGGPSQYVTFFSYVQLHLPSLLTIFFWIGSNRKAELWPRHLVNICQTWQWQSIDGSEAFHFQQIIC